MSDYAKLVEDLKRGFGHWYVEDWSRLVSMYADAAAAIEALLKENKELIEDRPEMVEADGHWEWRKPNGEVLMPKRGKWVEDTTTYVGPGLSNYKCSLCGKIGGTWRRGLKPSELPNWCGNCGADMRAKMEVQDGKRCD